MQFFQVGGKDLPHVRLFRTPERQLIVRNKGGQRGAQLVRHIRIEAFHL